jgi:voltage-gated potassium channel
LRLIRVLQAVRRVFSPQGLQWALLVGLLTIFIGGAGFAAMEQGPNPDVDNTWDGIWWAVCTMTTVGYGDIGPVTNSGRVLAIVVMLVGIGVVTMLIGATAERFVVHDVAEVEEDVAEKTGERRGVRDAGAACDSSPARRAGASSLHQALGVLVLIAC